MGCFSQSQGLQAKTPYEVMESFTTGHTILCDPCQAHVKLQYISNFQHPAFQMGQTVNIVSETFPIVEHMIWGLFSPLVFKEQLLCFLNHFFIIIPTFWFFTNANQLEKAMGTFLIKHLYGVCLFPPN